MLMIAPTVMMAKTPSTYPSASASFNIKALDQVFSANPSAVNPNGNCQAVVKLTAEIDGESNCASNNLIYYHVDIDLDSDGTIDMIASSKVNQNFATWTLDTLDQKMKCFMAPNAKGNFSFELPQFIQLNSIKTHKVSWHIYDECGQSSKTSSTFQVKDKKAPTPYCVSRFPLMLSNHQMVELWAKDFDKGAFDNCSHQDRLFFTFEGVAPILNRIKEPHFYKKGASGSVIATSIEYQQGKAYRWKPSVRSASLLIKFEYDYNINISVWDEAGNTDFCTVNLNNSIIGCSFPMALNGKVTNVLSAPINDARIQVDGDFPDYPKSQNSNQKGQYYFGANPGGFYQISCNINLMDSFNVNQNDLILLEKHLSGEKPFSYYWQFIAADINKDKEIDLADLNLLKRLVLNDSISTWIIIETNNDLNTSTWNNYNTHFERYFNQYEYATLDFTPILIGDIDGSHTKIDVVQYDSNNEIKSDENDISYKGQDLSNKGASSFEIIPQDQIFAAHPSPNDPNCMASVQLEAEIKGISNCVSNNLIYYHVEIDLDSDSTVNMIASSHVDKSFTSWTYDEVDKIQKLYVAPDAKGNYIMKLPAFALESKLIRHSVTWKISDECGNVSMQEVTMFCIDKKAPTPYCVSISTVMQSNPYIFEAVAIDYNKGAFDNCTPEDKLIFTFEGIYPLRELINEEHYYKKSGWTSVSATKEEYLKGMAYKWMPDKRSSSFIFTSCGDFVVNISVWDEAGNTDYCTIELRVLCVCTLGSVKIHGKVQSVSEKMIKEATIYIDGNALEYPKIYQTQDGSYSSYHPTILKYFVSGYYKTKQTFYVNQKDILRLEAHINGRDSFSHYWQYIAADVNQDKIVDQKDLEILQNKILAKDSTVWTLINKVDSLNTLNWHKYNTIVTVNGQNLDAKVDFTAILIGDIDGSSAGLDVVQYDSNHQLEDSNETTWRGTLSSNIEDLKAYPNPYADQFTIEFSNTQDEVVKLTLMDISGKVTHSMELQSFKGKNTFLIQDSFLLTSGIKLIRLESVSGVRHLKVLKTNGHH